MQTPWCCYQTWRYWPPFKIFNEGAVISLESKSDRKLPSLSVHPKSPRKEKASHKPSINPLRHPTQFNQTRMEIGGSWSFRENIIFVIFFFWVIILMQNHLTKKSYLGTKKKFHSYPAHLPNKLPNFLDFSSYSQIITTKWPS